jgi:hypothetical protein
MPTWGEGGPGRAIAGLGREEDGGIGAEDLADPEVRVQELAACQIQAVVGGTGAVGGGVRQHRVGGGILKRKERIGKVIEGVGDASGASARDKDNVTAIVRERGRDIKGPDPVVSPRLALERRVVDDHELTRGVDGACGKIHGRAVEPVPGRQGRI